MTSILESVIGPDRFTAMLRGENVEMTGEEAQRHSLAVDAAKSEEIQLLRTRLDDLEFIAKQMLSTYTEPGHPGKPAVRSCWVCREEFYRWHSIVYR